MSLEELRKSLLQEAKSEAKRLTSKAEKEAEEKLNASRSKAGEMVQQASERAQKAAEQERNERLSAVSLKAKKITSEAQIRVLEMGLGMIREEFLSLSEEKAQYEKLLKRLISDAEKEIGKGATVSVNSQDQALAKKYSKNVSKQVAKISGGAIVSSEDGSISIDNSLESLFSSREDELRKLVYTEMFGGKGK